MGLFDSVMFQCPKCKGTVEVQSKAGDCILKEYPEDDVPTAIAADIDGEVYWCVVCSEDFRVITTLSKTVRCWLR